MIPGKYSGLVTCVAAASMGMFVALWLLDFSLVRINWCSGLETVCFRDWLGALSGWAAAIGALVAAGLTISKLKEQITEQKRQVDFAIGDTPPIMEAINTNELSGVWVKVINWNRNTIYIDSINIPDTYEYELIKYVFEPKYETVPISGKIEKPIRLSGFEDRSTAPSIVNIYMQVTGIGEFCLIHPEIEIRLECRILHQKHTKIDLVATTQFATYNIPDQPDENAI